MATARNIMRGTFRLSVAVAALGAAYGVYQQFAAFSETEDQSLKMMITLECGARLSQETLKPAVNQYDLIDLGKVGCASEQFLASSEELRQARDGVMRREWIDKKFNLRRAAEYALAYAVLALLVVNPAGSGICYAARRVRLDRNRFQARTMSDETHWFFSYAQKARALFDAGKPVTFEDISNFADAWRFRKRST